MNTQLFKNDMVCKYNLSKDFINILDIIINDSLYIVELKDNWNDEGSIGYTEETYQNALEFIIIYLYNIENITDKFEIPYMFHSLTGGIDFDWDNDCYSFLIRCDKDIKLISFYYQNYLNNKEYIEGIIIRENGKQLSDIVNMIPKLNSK